MRKAMRARILTAAVVCGAATMLLGGAVGEAAPTPAITGQASAVTSTSAQLNGTIVPGGLATFWAFQYGISASYGQTTDTMGPLTGTTGTAVSGVIKNLAPGVTYHFRLVAVQGQAATSGESNGYTGADATFTTSSSGSTSSSSGTKHAKASLHSRTLHVSHGATNISWSCSGSKAASCKVKLSLTARGKVAGKVRTVSCGKGTFIANTGKSHNVRVGLSRSCLALVKAAHHHRLGARLKATAVTGTGGLNVKVTLVG